MAVKLALGDKFAALDSDTIISMLADMPEEKAAVESKENATGKNFETAMDNGKNPDVGTPGDKDSANQVSRADRALASTYGPRKAS